MTMTDEESARYRFAHSLIRRCITRQAAPESAELHRHAAGALERTVGTNPAQAARIAEHWRRAGFDPEALHATVRWKRAAATHAMTNQAPQIAARLLDQARAAQDRAAEGPADRAELLIELVTAEARAGQIASSARHCAEAATAAVSADRPDLLTAAALVIADAGDPRIIAATTELCDRALAALPTPGDRADPGGSTVGSRTTVLAQARLLARKACLDIEGDRTEDGTSVSGRAMRLAEGVATRPRFLMPPVHESGSWTHREIWRSVCESETWPSRLDETRGGPWPLSEAIYCESTPPTSWLTWLPSTMRSPDSANWSSPVNYRRPAGSTSGVLAAPRRSPAVSIGHEAKRRRQGRSPTGWATP